MKPLLLSTALIIGLMISAPAISQDEDMPQIDEDVITVIGRKSESGLKAMQAFNMGDYETAEIEFERHFDALKRTDRATKRAARVGSDAQISGIIAAGPGALGTSGGASAPGSAPSVDVSVSNSASASNAATQSATLRNASRQDLEVGYEDFAFARYMTGLSQIQLGKFAEAKESLRESVKHNYRNYDAQMRLGLLELRDGEALDARERLIRLDKMRQACDNRCEDAAELRNATLTLARALTDATAN